MVALINRRRLLANTWVDRAIVDVDGEQETHAPDNSW